MLPESELDDIEDLVKQRSRLQAQAGMTSAARAMGKAMGKPVPRVTRNALGEYESNKTQKAYKKGIQMHQFKMNSFFARQMGKLQGIHENEVRAAGGVFIRDRNTGQLLNVSHIKTVLDRLP